MPVKAAEGAVPMTPEDVRKAIRKFGKRKCVENGKTIYAVTCTVCGKEMLSSMPDKDGEYGASVTKRGTAVFWHGRCQKDLWNSRIK